MMFVIKLFIKRLTFGKRRQLCIYEEQSNAQSPSFTLQYNIIWLEFDLTTFLLQSPSFTLQYNFIWLEFDQTTFLLQSPSFTLQYTFILLEFDQTTFFTIV